MLFRSLGREADKIGYPVLIKAVAGGGGKGMRKVDAAADFADALTSCQREATSSFGNAHVLIEKYIQRPRHIEVQVFGDTHGNIVHLFERDCSLQRRHQKVIEEAPAPGMDEATREQLCAVAVKAAKAVDYVGAGTIEFIADTSDREGGGSGLRADRIWFMEMNTRLQVEHPVTEEITGVDLVEWQLRVASGEPLPKRQDELSINGWAMEARLYAEDPTKGFLPSVGRLDYFNLGMDGRIETGVAEHDEISPFYDPMIAKMISHGRDRQEAARYLNDIVSDAIIWPVKTNAMFLSRLLSKPEFLDGTVTTGFIDQNADVLTASNEPSKHALATAASWLMEADHHAHNGLGPWGMERAFQNGAQDLMGFRLNGSAKRSVRISDQSHEYDVPFEKWPNHPNVWGDGIAGGQLIKDGRGIHFFTWPRWSGGSGHHGAQDGTILSPMPGRIIAVDVAAGDAVTKGQKLVTLEAMKMEHSLTAPFDGTVAELLAEAGGQVSEGMLLVRIEASEP